VEGETLRGATLKPFGNGNPRPYSSVFERLLPDLRAAGCSPEELDQLLRENPARAFAIRVRAP
jgi:predicted metal-dependent phosphotriesterase family hydrolase